MSRRVASVHGEDTTRPKPATSGREEPLIVLGAGLAGLSLTCALLDEGYTSPILVLDRRREWDRDRTWCTWATRQTGFDDLVSHRWSCWRVRHGGREATGRSRRHPYVRLASDDVYARALARIERAPQVELRTGVTVHDVVTGDDGPCVLTSSGAVQGAVVADGLAGGSPLLRGREPGSVELAQRFLGWEVEVDAPAFDPAVATLMDFRPSADGLRFLYVLPFSSTRALVEDTSIGGSPVAPAARREALEHELGALPGVREWQLTHEERGVVAQTTYPFSLNPQPGVHTIGVAAGAVRPSSGYAFTRIQEHCRRLAHALTTGAPPPRRLAPTRLDVLDAVFLQALAADPQGFPDVLVRMVGGVSGDAFARFMTDTGTLGDENEIVAALPKWTFARAALRSLLAAAALA